MPPTTPSPRPWPAADRLFANLPPRLHEDLIVLRHSLATAASPTGQFADVLSAPDDEPWLSLHRWLRADLAPPGGPLGGDTLEPRLFLAMLCTWLAAAALEGEAGQPAPELAQALAAAADARFAAALPADSPFWAERQACWAAHAARVQGGSPGAFAADLARAAGRLAPLRLGAFAAASALGRADLIPALAAVLDPLCEAFEIRREIESLQRDAASRRATPVLALVLRAGGAPAGHTASNEWLLGALVFGGAMAALGRECAARLGAASLAASAAGLPALAAHCGDVLAAIEALAARFSLKAGARTAAAGVGRRAFVPRAPTPADAAQAAEGFLLADLSFRESWDVQRGLSPGLPTVVGRPFPAGLIVEILCRRGHRLAAQVGEVFALLQANGFCYFDHPGILPPDTDDLGLLLRLLRYSDRPADHQAILRAPLALLEVDETGAIPVWLRPAESAGDAPFALWGDDCITVQAQLTLGLLDADSAGYRAVIERSARSICQRVLDRGLGANRYYAPLYALWVLATLVGRLAGAADDGGRLLAAAEAALGGALQRAAVQAATPQDAALVILAASALDQPIAGQAALADRLIAEQRYDGSWRDEPLYVTCARGGLAAWYGSRAATTAICYDALRSLAAQ